MGSVVRDLNAWLVRHGQSTSNAGLAAVAHADAPLTELGQEQAGVIATEVTTQPGLLVDSPFLRARETADAIAARWPAAPRATWAIQEVTYLSPARCVGTTVATRQPLVDAYWQRADPDYLDGPDAETFAHFMQRVARFDVQLRALAVDFAVIVGHGQFFSAYRFARQHGFVPTPDWMRRFRAAETADSLRNGEILKLRIAPRVPQAT